MKEFALNKALSHFSINKDEFMQVYDKFNYAPHSVEEFVFENRSYVSDFMASNIVDYVKENELNIDTSVLEKHILAQQEWDKLDEIINEINYGYDYGYEDTQEELDRMLLEQDELYDLIKNTPTEVLKIKETINQLLK